MTPLRNALHRKVVVALVAPPDSFQSDSHTHPGDPASHAKFLWTETD